MEHWFLPLVFVALLLVVLGGGIALCLWFSDLKPSTPTKIEEQWEREQKARDMARCADIEEGLREWLTMLELPALADQTQIATAARQLRIVLVERLMRAPRVR